MRPSPIAAEVELYKRRRGELVANHDGEFVLIKGEEIVGYYPTLGEALDEGYRRYQGAAFLARQVSLTDETVNFTSFMLTP